ncbi:MAG TPA: ABC transporter permease [Pusillimonas sp.]|uniref:MlaE family ABC transporter permease n=1 Tax=unclassified Pusillimonas TaxID=2640016 RepID=UPI00262D8047|nr:MULTISPECIES: ABC transporter permease [unclassified Pusillimonas]HLU20667.1 ABC transporter permease [Pusillimonas sp.]
MPGDAQYLVLEHGADSRRLRVRGQWILKNYQPIEREIAAEQRRESAHPASAGTLAFDELDLDGLEAIDTAGAAQLTRCVGALRLQELVKADSGLPAERSALLLAVAGAQPGQAESPARPPAWRELLGRIGMSMESTWKLIVALLGFIGLTLVAFVRTLFQPRHWRVTSIAAQVEQAGLNAVPIVALLTFMVGAVIAFLGATVLADFGATIYTVTLVGFSFLREFAVLLTAILIAGRTASAYTAQLGSMKANEEIDAIRMMGLSPVDLLVLPRIIALLIALPALTFVGMVSGILGGMLVCAVSLDISPSMFLTIFQRDIEIRHFFLGMAKAPIFAYLIAVIGCIEGFKVRGSAQSVGQHTTSAVVQSIFVVILIDALAALFYMEMGW